MILKCSNAPSKCKSPFQDEMYGLNMRVHNPAASGVPGITKMRCGVCLATQEVKTKVAKEDAEATKEETTKTKTSFGKTSASNKPERSGQKSSTKSGPKFPAKDKKKQKDRGNKK